MSQISFANIAITAMATTVGNNIIELEDEKERFGFDDDSFSRLQRSIGLKTRYIADEGVCASDLCVQSAENIFANSGIKKEEIEALLFVTQSPDYKAPSTAIIMQNRLGLPTSCGAFDINLGCSGFIYGLFTAFSYVNSGMKKVLLCVGDVNSYFSGERDKIFTPLMGDAGSAIIIEKKTRHVAFFHFTAMEADTSISSSQRAEQELQARLKHSFQKREKMAESAVMKISLWMAKRCLTLLSKPCLRS